ncbi:carph-isopro domain-containing protein [Phytoactinopolyspora mesophila]|uniref:Transcriptional regulator n=1 Tax=Phytoactinopolyspora mesophila TaxID=2650750 RepID=A0A7K3MCX7_9ACTN|nr:transcriptional regulator [Phytoactinopolyspora mesophila]NDL61114.1 transcriptional regulator [Phytoactinopolyspora mesophila]
MSTRSGQPNAALASALDELGWSPKMLARKLNRVFGSGTTSDTAPYHWRDTGALPRSPLPTMAAYVLSQELGRVISVAELWQGRAADSPALLPADTDLLGPWTVQGLGHIVEDWILGGLIDRRRFLAVSGTGLTAVVAHYLDGTAGRGSLTPRMADQLDANPLVDQVEQHLPLLQLLDDEHGGARHLPYVSAQFRAIGLLVHDGGHSAQTTTRLIRALAEIGQLAGWMAFDAADHGLAQRYFVTALRAAHQVNDLPLCSHILADLAFQAASRGHPADAVTLGEAARRAADAAPFAVRASVLSRLAYAYASAGRLTDFSRTREAARETIGRRGRDEEPRWMYFLTDNHLDCQAGYAMIQLGRAQRRDGITASPKLIGQGTALLETGAYTVPRGDPSQRRALFEGAWLALGHGARGELELACTVGQQAADRLSAVRSPRSTALLQQLAKDLRRRQRNPHVVSFLPSLEQALSQHGSVAPGHPLGSGA